jgi:outer membrane beta-barrel protein
MFPPLIKSSRVTKLVSGLLALGFIFLLAGSSLAQEDDELDQGKVYAIQDRAHRMNQEFSIGLAFLPLDAFYKFAAITGHYVIHFNDVWAWEALHVSFAKYLDIDTGLQKEMNENWDTSATDTPRLDYAIDSNLMIKPMYGKMLLFDSVLINLESYFLVGLGAEKLETAWYPAANIGVGMRTYLSDTISIRLEVREYFYLSESSVDSVLFFGLGFCYNAFAPEKQVGRSREAEAWRQ